MLVLNFLRDTVKILWYAEADLEGTAFGVSGNIYEMVDYISEFNLQKKRNVSFLLWKICL